MTLAGWREGTAGAAAAFPLAFLPAGASCAPRDVANLAVYLARVAFRFIPGAEFVVDNGLLVLP